MSQYITTGFGAVGPVVPGVTLPAATSIIPWWLIAAGTALTLYMIEAPKAPKPALKKPVAKPAPKKRAPARPRRRRRGHWVKAHYRKG